MKYSAIAKIGEKLVAVRNRESRDAGEFYQFLRENGYSVNPKMIKPSEIFDYIITNTNGSPWDWERPITLEEVEKNG